MDFSGAKIQMPAPSARRWCFTYQLPEQEAPLVAKLPCCGDLGHDPKVRYHIYQLEEAPDTGRLHYQGYVEFTAPVRIPYVQRVMGIPRAHCEAARGSRDQCRDYCRKPESRVAEPVEFGSWGSGGAGKRNDIESALSCIRSGRAFTDSGSLWDDHGSIMVKYPRGMAAAFDHYLSRKTREHPPNVLVFYGDTGSGKTYKVFNSHPLQDVWRAPVSTSNVQWFDKYVGQPVALFDDFDGRYPHITVMLQVLDRYPLSVPVKGGHIHWIPTTIYITTNLPFEMWYPDASELHRRALKRRITRFEHMVFAGEPDEQHRTTVVPRRPFQDTQSYEMDQLE